MNKHLARYFGIVTVFVAVAYAAACSDDPVAPDEDEHAEPEGVQLIMDGQTIASYDGDAQSWTGELDAELGETTSTIEVRFVDHDGDAIHIDDDLYLEVAVDDQSIATFDLTTPGGFMGRVTGVAEGETSVVFRLMHGEVGSGHADFETTGVHIHVGGHT